MKNLNENYTINEKRKADREIDAFFYQIWHTIYSWINLDENEEIYIEHAEDFDVKFNDQLKLFQIKDTPSTTLSLNRKVVVKSLFNFWEFKRENPKYKAKFIYLTRSERGWEKKRVFGNIKGLDLWDELKYSRDLSKVNQIKEHIKSHSFTETQFRAYLEKISDSEFLGEFIDKVDWFTGQQEIEIIKGQILDKLIQYGNKTGGCSATEATRILPQLLDKVATVINSRNKYKKLNKALFIECFENATNKSISKKNWEILSQLAIPTLKLHFARNKNIDYKELNFFAKAISTSSLENKLEDYFTGETLQELILQTDIDIEQIIAGTKYIEQVAESPSILTYDERRALGLISTAVFPIWNEKRLAETFSNIPWEKYLKLYLKKKYVSLNNSLIEVNDDIKRIFQNDIKESKALHKEWVSAFEKLSGEYDVDFTLALHHFDLGNNELALEIIVDSALNGNKSFWSSLNYKILNSIYLNSSLEKYSSGFKVKFLNALAISASQLNYHEEAKRVVLRSISISKNVSPDEWGDGYTQLNAGVIHYKSGDIESAKVFYEKAKFLGEAESDNFLLGRALHNLGMILIDKHVTEAISYLEESIELKKKIEDWIGVAGSYLGVGNYYFKQKEYDKALNWYNKILDFGEEYYLGELRALANINLASSNLNLKKFETAKKLYLTAYELASLDVFTNAEQMALKGLANVCGELADFEKGEEYLIELLEVQNENNVSDNEILQTKIDIGVSKLRQGYYQEGRDLVSVYLEEARRIDSEDLVFQCRKLIAYSFKEESEELMHSKLKEFAKLELEQEHFETSFKLLFLLLEIQISSNFGDLNRIENNLNEAIRLCNDHDFKEKKIDLFQLWYNWKLNLNRFQDAIDVLDRFERSLNENDTKEIISIIDEKGRCNQLLGKFEEALQMHSKALNLSEKFNLIDQIEICSNNLGEGYRKKGDYEKAVFYFDKAMDIAKQRKDKYSELNILHNKAIVFENKSDYKSSSKLLNKIIREAEEKGFMDIYLKALYGLASNDSIQNNFIPSLKNFDQAYAFCKDDNEHGLLINIAIDYSGVLVKSDQAKKALRVLTQIDSKISDLSERHYLYMTIGKVKKELGNIESEIEALNEAYEIAINLNDSDFQVNSLLELADSYERIRNFEKSQNCYRSAIQIEEDPSWVASIYLDWLKLLLKNNKDKLAEDLYDEIVSYTEEHNLVNPKIDLYIIIGDHNWFQDDSEEKIEGIKSYLVALMSSLKNPELFVDLGMYIHRNLMDLYNEKGLESINKLVKSIREWLKSESESSTNIDQIMWPIIIAQKISTKMDLVPDIEQSELNSLFNEVYARIFNVQE